MPLQSDERIVFSRGELFAPVEDRTKKAHLDRYRLAIERIPCPGRVLDLGCGVGYGALLMATRALIVTAVDYDEETIFYAKMFFGNPSINYMLADVEAEEWTFPWGQYNAVTAFEIIEHLKNPEVFLEKCHNELAPRGLLFISTPIVKIDNGFHKHFFSEKTFRELVEGRFRVEEKLVQNDEICMLVAYRL